MSPGDSVLTDCGFSIESDLKELKVDLNIPSFLGWRAQLTAAEVKESQTVASVRIHVERAIQRVNKFKVMKRNAINSAWFSKSTMDSVLSTACCGSRRLNHF